MIRKLMESDNVSQFDPTALNKIERLIGNRAGRFGFDMDAGAPMSGENGLRHIVLFKKDYPDVIIEMYPPFEEALIRIDISKVLERYTYGNGKKLTLKASKSFKDALNNSLELATTIEALFDYLV